MKRPYFKNIFKNRNIDCIIEYIKDNVNYTLFINLNNINNLSNKDLHIEYDNIYKSFKITNISTKKITIKSVEIFILKLNNIFTNIFQHGYQSWSPTYLTSVKDKQKYTTNIPIISYFVNLGTNLHHNKNSKYWGFSNVLISNMFTVLNKNKNNDENILYGFTDFDKMCGEFILIDGNYLIAYEDYDKILNINDSLITSKIIKLKGDNNVYNEFANHIGIYSLNKEIPTGWCSWYELKENINEKNIISNLNKIYDANLNIKYIQIDDGYMKNIGDWLDYDNIKFPNGLSYIIDQIKSKNYKCGIWLAPFLVSRSSNIFKQHPDWILKDRYGKMVFATFNDTWNGNYTYSLDLTHPEVKEYIFNTFSYFKKQGFIYFKLDFLCAGMLKGNFYDNSLNRVEVYRNALQLIRKSIGNDAYILGCGAPISASIGLVDFMRISPDTDFCWNPPFISKLFADGVGIPCVKYQLRNVISRQFMHKKWWINDSDVVVLSNKLEDDKFILQTNTIHDSGVSIFFSDDLDNVSENRINILKKMLT